MGRANCQVGVATFTLNAVNIGTFPLGESDRIVVLFSRERGLHRAVAKGARKPGSKMAGKSEPLTINRYLLAQGKSLDIVTQCETLESFPMLRRDLERLTYALYFAELSQVFGQELSEDAANYFEKLSLAIGFMADGEKAPALQCLEFELLVLGMLGLSPELTFCVGCRETAVDRNIAAFNYELGGVVCQNCLKRLRKGENEHGQVPMVAEVQAREGRLVSVFLTPMVWRQLILAKTASQASADLQNLGEAEDFASSSGGFTREDGQAATRLAQALRLMLGYIEYKSGRRMRSLEVLSTL